jgi:hypothetical protein
MKAPKRQFIVDEGGKTTAVVLPVAKYRKLLEDLHDLAVVAERREEEAISLDEMKRRLKADGIVQDSVETNPSPVTLRLIKAPVARHPLPTGEGGLPIG